jgi:hypothetical protein
LGLYDYNARYYDANIGRFISADVIVPHTSRLTPLTVGFHETMFIEQANGENAQLMQLGPVFRWGARQKQELGTADGPATPQNLNRFAYAANNPTSYVDSTGHNQHLPDISEVTQTHLGDGWWEFALGDMKIRLHEQLHERDFNQMVQHKINYNNYIKALLNAVRDELVGGLIGASGTVITIFALLSGPIGWMLLLGALLTFSGLGYSVYSANTTYKAHANSISWVLHGGYKDGTYIDGMFTIMQRHGSNPSRDVISALNYWRIPTGYRWLEYRASY